MREIKFRQWDSDEKYMSQTTTHIPSSEHHKVMQYTGLHDKNGTKIYESDIVKNFLSKPSLVKFGEYSAGGNDYYANSAYGFYVQGFFLGDEIENEHETLHGQEVIGDIYQHPELLK